MTDNTVAAPDPRLGRVLDGKWTLERLLGVGGMASVYAARHRNGARAAVKILHTELAKHQQIRERFLREGYAANRVEHEGAVKVLDDDIVKEGPDEGAAYIVMELLDGELLEDRATRAPMSERELLLMAESILDVLEAAHAHGVIHRDLKPDNLFVVKSSDGSMRVKVLDFGLARVTEGSRLQTRAGITLGTPAFMSPEQAGGRSDEIDGRSDVFSLGAVMFRLRTGKRIHEGSNALEIVTTMAKLPAPKLATVDPAVSPAFAAIVDRAIAFAREDRYPDAATMRADVRAALDAMEPVTVVEPPRSAGGRWFLSLLVIVGIIFGAIWVVRAGLFPTVTASSDPASASASASPPIDAAVEDADASDDASDAAVLALIEEDATTDAGDDAEEEEEEEEDDDASVDGGEDALADANDDTGDAAEDAHEVGAAGKALNELIVAPPQPTAKKPVAKPAPAPKKKPAPTTGYKKKKKRRKKK